MIKKKQMEKSNKMVKEGAYLDNQAYTFISI